MGTPPYFISDPCTCINKQIRYRLIYGWGQRYCGYCKRAIKWGVASFDPMKRTDGR